MSIPFSNTHHRIPPGFANLLEGLAREVLREQPEDIPAFAANYFEELLDKREKTKFDPAEWGAKLDDRFYNNKAFEVGWAGIAALMGLVLMQCTGLKSKISPNAFELHVGPKTGHSTPDEASPMPNRGE
uniref:Sperm surface protein Sp17 n=1 Tax=Terrapene triunguis TaxID=2587831 RepID=A0A674J2X8_9SAUR